MTMGKFAKIINNAQNRDGISICITCKNRSKFSHKGKCLYLLPNCIDSIIESSKSLNCKIEVVISDWNSTDWPLEEWLPQKLKNIDNVCYKIITVNEEIFSAGYGRAIAFKNSSFDKFLFLDADMLVNYDLIKNGISVIDKGGAFFPMSYDIRFNDHTNKGWGNVFISRENFLRVGPWISREKYGEEDKLFFKKCIVEGIKTTRYYVSNFIHQWHPRYLGWIDEKSCIAQDKRKKKKGALRKKRAAIDKKREVRESRMAKRKHRKK
jgi:glycosyltransferase involved in cell wall biosynthesis